MKRKMNMKAYHCIGIWNFIVLEFLISAGYHEEKRNVDITSAFKPVLKESAKINFNASPPSQIQLKPRLNYDIPNQNLLFAYQPVSLNRWHCRLIQVASLGTNSYIKAGFGSLKTPFVQAGFSFGDGNTAGLNIYAKHVSSQGKRDFQDLPQYEC